LCCWRSKERKRSASSDDKPVFAVTMVRPHYVQAVHSSCDLPRGEAAGSSRTAGFFGLAGNRQADTKLKGQTREEAFMTKWIGAVILALTVLLGGSAATTSAAAAAQAAVQKQQADRATDFSARRYYRRYHRYGYRPYYRPYYSSYYARPYYYRPYPYYAPAPFPFGFGFGFRPWGW
jgi:hypothetical protein